MDKDTLAEQAKNRMLSGVKVNPTQNSAEGYQKGETREILAKSAGISHDTLSRIAKIKEQCTPEIVASCRKGEITVNKAYTDQVKKEIQERNAILCNKLKNRVLVILRRRKTWRKTYFSRPA